MVVISEKSHAEYYRDRLRSQSSDAQPNLPAPDLTAGTPCIICPSHKMREAMYYHDMGFIEKLTYKLTAWLRMRAD